MISPCQGRHGKYLKKNYCRKFHVGVLASAWDLRHFVMPRILLCISESVCSRQSGTVPGSSRAELLCELPLASLLQIAPENVRNCKNGRIGRWPNAARRRYWTCSGNTSLPSQLPKNLPLGNCRCNAQRGTWIAPYPASRAWTGMLYWYTGTPCYWGTAL